MAKIVALGEIMLRLSPQAYQRISQASAFDIHYGGGEANVAVELAQFGHEAVFITKLPQNPIGDCAMAFLRKNGVNGEFIVRGGKRMGIYFLEHGASVRPSSVLYDRTDSAITQAEVEEFDFDRILQNTALFHLSGITPILSNKTAKLALAAVQAAKRQHVTVSFDLNYREKLWTTDREEKQKWMQAILPYVDICFGNALDATKCLGYSDGVHDFLQCDYKESIKKESMEQVVKQYQLQYLVSTVRENHSASDNGWSAVVSDGKEYYKGSEYSLHIIDRVGSGDAFAAGFLHGYLEGKDMKDALEFAIAAAAIKHTVLGDINHTTVEEVENLIREKGTARVVR